MLKTSQQKPRRHNRPSIDHFGPRAVLDAAYCYYLVDTWPADKPQTATIRMAFSVVADFERLCQSFCDSGLEASYLFTVKQIMVSLSRGLARGKQTLTARVESAHKECQERLAAISKSTQQSGFWQGSKQMLLFGGFGFVLVRALIPWLDLPSNSQPNFLSAAAGLGLALLMFYIKAKLTDWEVTRVFAYHQYLHWFANQEYGIGAKTEYQRAEHAARAAWKQLTGREAPRSPGFDALIEEQLELQAEFRRMCTRLTSSPVISFFTYLQERRKHK
jgi:hypothetical protein